MVVIGLIRAHLRTERRKYPTGVYTKREKERENTHREKREWRTKLLKKQREREKKKSERTRRERERKRERDFRASKLSSHSWLLRLLSF